MKKIYLILLLLSSFNLKAQIYDVDTLLYNGDINKLINIVILGDGYTVAQTSQFITNAQSMSNYLFSVEPFLQYKKYFNVFIIKVPSIQSGVSHPGTATDVPEPAIPVVSVNNFYGSRFDVSNIHRLLVPSNYSNINSVVANNFPLYDQILILANSTEYGGSGGTYATSSINTQANEIVVHELGHSFAGLADEYTIGGQGERPNRTTETNTNLVKWKSWLNINNIGIFSVGIDGWQRPHQNCKMRALGLPFCSVCTEAIVEKIHSLTNPIQSFQPSNTTLITAGFISTTFSLNLIKPNPNTIGVTWKLNGLTVGTNETLQLSSALLQNSTNTLTGYIIDNTSLSKSTTHASAHTYQVTWSITNCGNTATLLSPTDDVTIPITITAKSSGNIQASNQINAVGANITYQTGNFIQLSPGFNSNQQTYFLAKIALSPCN
jgi:hypothetical protein